MSEPLLRVEQLTKSYPIAKRVLRGQHRQVRAVDGVSFELHRGETLALVGESGCGKSTLARCLLRLVEPSSGSVYFDGKDVGAYRGKELRDFRRSVQLVFQDPSGALNPRMTVGDLVAEPLRVHGLVENRHEARRRAGELLEMVGLRPDHGTRYGGEFSGGQQQRIVIARALSCRPPMLILDEPVAALDASTGTRILDLLTDLQQELGVAYLLISHDLSVVRNVADRVAVMYLGAFMETARVDDLFSGPQHPYTQALLSAVPLPDPRRERIRARIALVGEVPSAADVPPGCRFHTRCFKAQAVCSQDEPPLALVGEREHRASCLFAEPRKVL